MLAACLAQPLSACMAICCSWTHCLTRVLMLCHRRWPRGFPRRCDHRCRARCGAQSISGSRWRSCGGRAAWARGWCRTAPCCRSPSSAWACPRGRARSAASPSRRRSGRVRELLLPDAGAVAVELLVDLDPLLVLQAGLGLADPHLVVGLLLMVVPGFHGDRSRSVARHQGRGRRWAGDPCRGCAALRWPRQPSCRRPQDRAALLAPRSAASRASQGSSPEPLSAGGGRALRWETRPDWIASAAPRPVAALAAP